MLMQAAGIRNKLNEERDRHRGEVEELGGDVNALATKLRQREECENICSARNADTSSW
jgi:hypothetical protein